MSDDKLGHPHKAGHSCNRCSAGSRPALVTLCFLIGKAEQLSALQVSRLMRVAINWIRPENHRLKTKKTRFQ